MMHELYQYINNIFQSDRVRKNGSQNQTKPKRIEANRFVERVDWEKKMFFWYNSITNIKISRWNEVITSDGSSRSPFSYGNSSTTQRDRYIERVKVIKSGEDGPNKCCCVCFTFNFTTEYTYWICGGMFNVSIKYYTHLCLHHVPIHVFHERLIRVWACVCVCVWVSKSLCVIEKKKRPDRTGGSI